MQAHFVFPLAQKDKTESFLRDMQNIWVQTPHRNELIFRTNHHPFFFIMEYITFSYLYKMAWGLAPFVVLSLLFHLPPCTVAMSFWLQFLSHMLQTENVPSLDRNVLSCTSACSFRFTFLNSKAVAPFPQSNEFVLVSIALLEETDYAVFHGNKGGSQRHELQVC